MNKKIIILLITVLLMTSYAITATLPEGLDSIGKKAFQQQKGTFVIYDLTGDKWAWYNKKRADKRFYPKSTFKIANSLFALETGVIKDIDTIIPWDSQRDPKQPWWDKMRWAQDHNMRTAIKYSVVWFYQELARRIGKDRMKKLVVDIGYGNQNTNGQLDRFWLDGPIQISANEQIQFLKRFYLGKLGFSTRTTDWVKKILIQEKTTVYTLSAKTGGGSISDDKAIGWYVGYVERGKNVYFFALNIEGPTFNSINKERIDICRQILKELLIL